MTPDEQTIYMAQLKRLGEIIVKRISDEIKKAKFLDVYSSYDDLERLTNIENRYKSLSEVLSQRNLPLGLEMVIIELREIENELQQERFDKEQSDTSGTYYEIELANHLVNVNKRFPEDTQPHLRPGEDNQLPDATGPVGGKRKTRRSIKKKRVKKTRHKRGGARPPQPEPLATPFDIMANLHDHLPTAGRPELYPRYINEAFAVIGDINTIEALYREGELGYFFNYLIIDRFRNAIEHDRSNWNVIQENIRSRQPGRIVGLLELRNRRLARMYQEKMVEIGRLNPVGGRRKTKKSKKSKKTKKQRGTKDSNIL